MSTLVRRALDLVALLAVAVTAVFSCWPLIRSFLVVRPSGTAQDGGDYWLYVYYLIVGIQKLDGTSKAGLWDAGYFYPVHEMSLLFTEPTLGVTVALYPVWKLTNADPFLTLAVGAITALVLGWVAAYCFARHFSASRMSAFMAATGVGTSCVFLWVLVRPFFWAFPLVLLTAIVVDRACTSGKLRFGLLGGFLIGALAWCSLHLSVMATLLIALLVAWRFATGARVAGSIRAVVLFGAIGTLIAAVPFIAQAIALLGNGFSRPLAVQTDLTPNFSSFFCAPWTRSGAAAVKAGLSPPRGEFAIGISLILWVLAACALAAAFVRRSPVPSGPSPATRTRMLLAVAVLAIVLIAAFVPDVIGGHAIDRWMTAGVYLVVSATIVLARRRIAAALRQPDAWFACCAGVFLLMCLGPVLRPLEGHAIPSPLLPLFRAPGFSGIRVSARWSLMLAPCLATAAALFLDRLSSATVRTVLALVLAGLMIADNIQPGHWSGDLTIPSSATAWQPRPVDNALMGLPKPGAVMELPYLSGPPESARMISRLYHQRPLVNGYGGFEPKFFLDHMIVPSEELLLSSKGPTQQSVALLREFGARYWIVHLAMLPAPVAARFGETFGPLVRVASVEDGKVLIYEDTGGSLTRSTGAPGAPVWRVAFEATAHRPRYGASFAPAGKPPPPLRAPEHRTPVVAVGPKRILL